MATPSGWPVECKMSGKMCAAFGCNNYENGKDKHGLSFFRFPRDKERYVFNALFHFFCRVDWVAHRKTLHLPQPCPSCQCSVAHIVVNA